MAMGLRAAAAAKRLTMLQRIKNVATAEGRAANRANKALILRQKTALAEEKASLARAKAKAKGYRKGRLNPETGEEMGRGSAKGQLAGSVPIGAGLAASGLTGLGGAISSGIQAAGDVAEALLTAQRPEIPTLDTGPGMKSPYSAADRNLIKALARLDARTRVKLAREQRAMAREVAFLSNPVIGVGVAFALGAGTIYGIHALAEVRDSAGAVPSYAYAAQNTAGKLPTSFTPPTLPTGYGGGANSFQIAP